jgi:DNA polymerase III epsilon subunit-like protein
MSIDQSISIIQDILSAEREAGRCNDLDDLVGRKIQRDIIGNLWTDIQAELKQLKTDIDSLPFLPPYEQILWAQTIIAMPALRFLEIDTTGLEREDEICRISLVDGIGRLADDFLIRPKHRQLTDEASYKNGLKADDLARAPLLSDVWSDIADSLRGTYILSFNQDWDRERLKEAADRTGFPPICLVGECLQRRATQYYHKEYYLSLDKLCARVGYPLPEPPAQTSIDRAVGQYHFLVAMASGVTDVQPPKSSHKELAIAISTPTIDDTDALGDLDDHPF